MSFHLTDYCVEGDWAYHNAIINGGNKAHLWRTLTRDEWYYLIYQRKDGERRPWDCHPSGRAA
ncbi:MAG: hypothetical protein II525_00540 [Bacteroidales bacterium]|nr:hypothetical protein [Bacteroidales bacterium]